MLNWLRRLLGPEAKAPAPSAPDKTQGGWTISHGLFARAKAASAEPVVFKAPDFPKSVLPANGADKLANDADINEINVWAGQAVLGMGANLTFIGYPYLSELAQRPEYRKITEVLATESTRKWIKLQSKTDTITAKGQRIADPAKAERLAELTKELERLDVQGAMCRMVELDGFFGRAHLMIDTGSNEDRNELITPIGDGRSTLTLAKFKGRKGFLKAIKPIEPVWCYPAKYNATNPLLDDWYRPQTWFVQGTEIHRSRLMTFVGREVPDLLKPSYAFGGLSLSQMAKPYVDNWLRTRQAVADLIWSFSVRGLKTNLSSLMAADGEQLFRRAAVFASTQTNQGLMLVDKDTEELFQISTPLGSLDALQLQSMEQMCLPSGIPIVKFFGSQATGLNASSEGQLEVWYDTVEAFQKKFITPHLHELLGFAMINIWGEVDEDIVHEFVELRSQTEKEEAETAKIEAETHIGYIEAGVIDPLEVRAVLASDPNSPYDGIDPDEVPEPQQQEGDDPLFPSEDVPELGSVFNKLGAASERDNPEREDRTRQRSRDEGQRRPEREDRTRERTPLTDG